MTTIDACPFASSIRRLVLPVLLSTILAACAGSHERLSRPEALSRIQPANSALILVRAPAWRPETSPRPRPPSPVVDLPRPLMAEIEVPKRPLQCVPFARDLSSIQIHGDAWTWWDQAEDTYQRGRRPEAGAVLVLERRRNSLGHVAYVEEVVDNRTIIVSHANWLRKGQIHRHTPVIDVSKANDWSELRFWNAEGGYYGGGVYKPYGFIYGHRQIAAR